MVFYRGNIRMLNYLQLKQYRENGRIEAKKSLGGLPKSIWETYSAFANTLGGYILLGVIEKEDKSLEAVDLPDPKGLIREFTALLNDPKKVSANILSAGDVYEEDAEGKHIVVIHVPKADRTLQPVYLDGDPANAYKRYGEQDIRCDTADYERMAREAAVHTPDMTLYESLNLSDLKKDTIDRFRKRMEEVSPGHPLLTADTETFLKKTGCAAADGQGRLHPTGGGLLLFGKGWALRTVYPMFSLKYDRADRTTENKARLKACTYASQLPPEGALCENVWEFYETVEKDLILGMTFPEGSGTVTEEIRGALREALANQLENTDYFGVGSWVLKGEHKLIFNNAGLFRPEVSAARRGVSDPRNAILKRMFDLTDREHEAGGLAEIYLTWRAQGLAMPVIRQTTRPNVTRLTLPLHPEESRAKADRDYVRELAEDLIVFYLTSHGSARVRELADFLNMSDSAVRRHLEKLCSRNLVERIQEKNVPGRAGIYKLRR